MNQTLTVIGIGKLGLSVALTFEKSGFDVIGIDLNEKYVNNLNKKNFNSDLLIEKYIKLYENLINL